MPAERVVHLLDGALASGVVGGRAGVLLDGRRVARVRVTRVALPTEGDEGPQEA